VNHQPDAQHTSTSPDHCQRSATPESVQHQTRQKPFTSLLPTNAITDGRHHSALLSPQTIFRGEQCAGARPHAGRCWAAVQWRRRSGPQHRCRHRGAVLGGRAPPGAVTRVRSGRPAGGRRREDVRTPARLVVALSPPPVPPWDVRPAGRADVQRPGVRCPGVRCPGVRTDRPPLSAAMPPRGPRRAGPGVAGVWGRPVGRSGSRCPRCPRAGGRLPASGLTGSDGAAVGRARLPRGRP
jgi:hypothetical protein